MDRSRAQNAWNRPLRRAGELSGNPSPHSVLSGSGSTAGSGPTPSVSTRDDGSGNTIHPLVWGLDNWGDALALWTDSD